MISQAISLGVEKVKVMMGPIEKLQKWDYIRANGKKRTKEGPIEDTMIYCQV
jgi:hypothetical protein